MSIHKSVYNVIFNRVFVSNAHKIRKDGDFYLAISTTQEGILSLNRLAAEIYQLCDGLTNVKMIYDSILKRYADIDEDVLTYDICMCVSNMERLGLLRQIPSKIQ